MTKDFFLDLDLYIFFILFIFFHQQNVSSVHLEQNSWFKPFALMDINVGVFLGSCRVGHGHHLRSKAKPIPSI